LTKSIKELEEGIAAQLFIRRSKGVTLTECGESFYQHASLILEELRSAQEDILQRQGKLAGQINIGMGASVARLLMPAVITRFHQQHPQEPASKTNKPEAFHVYSMRQAIEEGFIQFDDQVDVVFQLEPAQGQQQDTAAKAQ
jgi:DNA-binding transcriptional LysR family regulator